MTLASLREAIAIVSQEVTLFDDTIRANIALGRLGASDDEIVAAAKAAAATSSSRAAAGYDTLIGEAGCGCRAGSASAWRSRAPSSRTRRSCCSTRRPARSTRIPSGWCRRRWPRFTRNRTTLVIAHRLSTVQRADLICVMEEGRRPRSAPTPS